MHLHALEFVQVRQHFLQIKPEKLFMTTYYSNSENFKGFVKQEKLLVSITST